MGSQSTSWHTLSADRRLSKFQRIRWFACNLMNNAFSRVRVDRRINERKFRLPQSRLDALWADIREDATPSRRLCDLFWMSLPWHAIQHELGPINALEVGCGSGTYGRMLERLAGNGLQRYVGIDIEASPAWPENQGSKLSFQVARASDVPKFLPGSNLVMTQSALEHFEEDLLFFRHLAAFVQGSSHPVLQMHLLPSADCISTFVWHGIRNYTPRTLSGCTRLFGAETTVYLFRLGGSACNRTHREFITWPHYLKGGDVRIRRAAEYRQSVRSAILSDFVSEGPASSFYGLVLLSRFKDDPFQDWCAD